MKRRIVLLGPPASGKGTQAEMLRNAYQLPIVSTGAILREEQRLGTQLGKEAAAITRTGGLLPDATILSLIRAWLAAHNSEFVFDGFPRTVNQARSLDALLAERGTPLELVIALEADLPTLQERVTRRLVCTQCRAVVSTGLHVDDVSAPCPVCGGTLV
ncbi:MAG TPA: nucleoside monophosphate kinase, partial [Chthoniobacteraceae bacterium]|nr:nucleoside monophosphate kinase [Chthoniobacteraceae bacterium]